ncbi:hypothetical protein [Natronosalvus caseinilyticus]|uniref:hypothetical protein n=1 Tax=Natronosalvus caseinilyticus TaxID=2953747 RepID=UPI0028ACF579|nr:hypothetical protein [Natronosalvus caseinilyticus]
MRRRGYLVGLGTSVGVLVSVTDGGLATATDLSVRILETNDPIEAGEYLTVTAEVTNTTASELEVTAEFLVGGDPVGGRWTFLLEGGETRDLEFSHLTYPVRQDVEFPVRVETRDGSDERLVTVTGIDDLPADRVRPGSQVTVAPGSTVQFETEPDDAESYGGVTHWYVDDEYAGWSMGPWQAEYFGWTGRDYWQYTFDEPGTYTVRASVGQEGANATAEWTVEVAEGGHDGPAVEAVRPVPGRLAVGNEETVELAVDVTDAEGRLEEVVWWLGHADRILEISSVSGSSDTATLEVDGASLCHGCPVIVWVRSSDGTVTTAQPWTPVEPDGGHLHVSIQESNDPVGAGEPLEFVLDLENVGPEAATREVSMVVGGEVVDTLTTEVDGGGTDSLTLGYDTYPVRQDVEFPVWVTTGDDADHRTVSVYADGVADLEIRILETNAPVAAGEVLSVLAEVENVGTESMTRDVHLVAGDRVASEQVSLDPGAVETLELGYETYPVRRNVEFPVSVWTEGACDRRLVRVYAEGVPPLVPRISEVNDPVTGGERLEVTVELENRSDGRASEDVSLVVGGETVDSASATVEGGETETLALGYETYPVRQDVEFPITVVAGEERDERTVSVRGVDGGGGDGDDDDDGSDDDDDEEGDGDGEDDGDETEDLEVTFVDCSRVEVTGTFEDGDTIMAHTAFNTDHGIGTTAGEDFVTIGEHVPAPFSGTVVFEIGDERGVSGDGSSATVTVEDYGVLGTAITGIGGPSAIGPETTHSNPHDCSESIAPIPPELEVASVSPAGDGYDVTFGYTNDNEVSIIVGSSFTTGTASSQPPNELTAGGGSFTARWTPQSGDERLEWTVDLSAFGGQEPIRVATQAASAYGDGEEPSSDDGAETDDDGETTDGANTDGDGETDGEGSENDDATDDTNETSDTGGGQTDGTDAGGSGDGESTDDGTEDTDENASSDG